MKINLDQLTFQRNFHSIVKIRKIVLDKEHLLEKFGLLNRIESILKSYKFLQENNRYLDGK